MYSVRYYPRFHVTAVGLGNYYLRIRRHYCNFSTLSQQWHDFRKKKQLNIIFFFSASVWKVSHSKQNWAWYELKCILLIASGAWCANCYSCVSDPMVDSWFLMSSPLPVLTILGIYLYFVLKLGPQLMANRKAFNLQKILVAYNFYQVLFSLWLCTMVSIVHRLFCAMTC
jgi:hypothetical protein